LVGRPCPRGIGQRGQRRSTTSTGRSAWRRSGRKSAGATVHRRDSSGVRSWNPSRRYRRREPRRYSCMRGHVQDHTKLRAPTTNLVRGGSLAAIIIEWGDPANVAISRWLSTPNSDSAVCRAVDSTDPSRQAAPPRHWRERPRQPGQAHEDPRQATEGQQCPKPRIVESHSIPPTK
jgi:hypothetical protein